MNLLKLADHLDNLAVNLREEGSTVDLSRAKLLESWARKARLHNDQRDMYSNIFVGTVWHRRTGEEIRVSGAGDKTQTYLYDARNTELVFDHLMSHHDGIVRMEVLPLTRYLSDRPRSVQFLGFIRLA